MIPGPFHLPTTHKISILLESNQFTISSLLQTITIAFLSMAISIVGDMAASPSSPAGSAASFAVGASSDDSASPVTSPIALAENRNKDPIKVEEWSDAGSDEEKIGGLMFWSEEENSHDPVDGNSKKGSHY